MVGNSTQNAKSIGILKILLNSFLGNTDVHFEIEFIIDLSLAFTIMESWGFTSSICDPHHSRYTGDYNFLTF